MTKNKTRRSKSPTPLDRNNDGERSALLSPSAATHATDTNPIALTGSSVRNRIHRQQSERRYPLDGGASPLSVGTYGAEKSILKSRVRSRPLADLEDRQHQHDQNAPHDIIASSASTDRSTIPATAPQRHPNPKKHYHQQQQQQRVGFLEMEASPGNGPNTFRAVPINDNILNDANDGKQHQPHHPKGDDANLLDMDQPAEPLRTTSGLQLTHRQTPPVTGSGQSLLPHQIRQRTNQIFGSLEVDNGMSYPDPYHNQSSDASYAMRKIKRMLSLTQCWIVGFGLVMLLGTGIALHHSRHEGTKFVLEKQSNDGKNNQNAVLSSSAAAATATQAQNGAIAGAALAGVPDRIILVPVPNITQIGTAGGHRVQPPRLTMQAPEKGSIRRALRHLRDEFETWVEHHDKKYHSEEEKNKRFEIWADNHERYVNVDQRVCVCVCVCVCFSLTW